MYYCKELFSLNILSLYEGELLGAVNRLYFDKKLKRLLEIELINEEGAKLILSTKNIYHIGKNAITIKNNQCVDIKIDETDLVSCPIGSKAYSITGEYLGLVTEITVNEKFVVDKISLDNNTTLTTDLIATLGKNTIIFYEEIKKVNINKFSPTKQPKTLKVEDAQEVNILPSTPPQTNNNIVPVEPTIQTTDFILGRVCKKDILNFNSEVLIKANSVVTKKHLKEINRFGKLRELMLYLK